MVLRRGKPFATQYWAVEFFGRFEKNDLRTPALGGAPRDKPLATQITDIRKKD